MILVLNWEPKKRSLNGYQTLRNHNRSTTKSRHFSFISQTELKHVSPPRLNQRINSTMLSSAYESIYRHPYKYLQCVRRDTSGPPQRLSGFNPAQTRTHAGAKRACVRSVRMGTYVSFFAGLRKTE